MEWNNGRKIKRGGNTNLEQKKVRVLTSQQPGKESSNKGEMDCI